MSDYRRGPRRPDDGYSGRDREGTGPGGGEPRMTRAEMRRAAQGTGRGSGRRKPDTGRRPGGGHNGGAAAPSGRKRLIDYPRTTRHGLRRWVPSWRQVLGVFLILFGGMTAGVGYAYATTVIPNINPSTTLQDNVFYWSDGSLMARVGQVDRQNVTLADVPKGVQQDFLAAENATFYTDPGIDPQGIARAVLHMAEGGEVQSGSTITQQFVKNGFLNQSQTVTRKLREIMISLKIGTKYSKDQILEGYLNSNYYGRGAYGIQAAAEAYYGVPASKLTISQGAFLTATVNEPSVMMNADTDPTARAQATGRWKYVLSRMVTDGWLPASQEQQFLAAGFPTPKPMSSGTTLSGQIGYLTQLASQYVESTAHLTDQQFNRGGYQIYTTFNKKDVDALAASVAKMRAQHINPSLRPADKNVQVGAASVDPRTGAIVAIYGGAGFDKGYFTDNANSVGIQVGSTFKPFDLAAALDHGAVLSPGQPVSKITPESKFNGNDHIQIKDQNGQYITDANDPTGFLHQANDDATPWGYITLRKAMEQSVNTPYVQLGEYVGYGQVEQEAINAGLLRSSLEYNTAGFFIGTSTPSMIRMADAYGTFADGGVHHEPYSVTKVMWNGTQQPGFAAPQPTQAMPADTANTVNDVLQDVVKNGTGTHALALGRPAAGKTGTTDGYKSALFIGYTPQLSTAVTMFKEDPNKATLESMAGVGNYSKVFGADMPTQVWLGYMSAALQGQPVLNFPAPPQLGQGANENGAPAATPSPSPTPSVTPSATPSPTPTPATPTQTPCRQLLGSCDNASPTPTDGGQNGGGAFGGNNGNGGGGLLGGGSGSTPAPSNSPAPPGRGNGRGFTTGG